MYAMARMAWENDADVEFDAVAGHLNALHGRMVATAAWLLANPGEWQGDGIWTPEAYICWRTGVSRATASKIVDIARRVDELPNCVATMQRGELSLDQMAPIARHTPDWADAQMSGLATRLTVTQISKVARQYPWAAGDTGVPSDQGGEFDNSESADTLDESSDIGSESSSGSTTANVATEPDDMAWYGWDDHGRFRLHLDVGADTGAMLESAIEERHDRLFHERTDTESVSVVAAVIEMAARSLDSVESPSRRSRFRTNVHVEASSGTVTDRRGRPIADGPAARITCDSLVSIVTTQGGVPVSVGRSQHIVPDRTRRLVEHRDGGCRVPGCQSDRFVEVHHIIHWSNSGPTDSPNLLCLCPTHHRLHHQGKLAITGDADRAPGSPGAVEFADRHGIPIRSSGAQPSSPIEAPPPIDGEWEHPLAERLDMHSLFFQNDAHPAGRP